MRERGTPVSQPVLPTPQQAQPAFTENAATSISTLERPSLTPSATPDPNHSSNPPQEDASLLPPVRASASAPHIDPAETGTYSGLSIFEVDLQNLSDKNWRRPGADVSDWFNYGFDEISWEAYCVRKRDMAAMAAEMKANVLVSIRGCALLPRVLISVSLEYGWDA